MHRFPYYLIFASCALWCLCHLPEWRRKMSHVTHHVSYLSFSALLLLYIQGCQCWGSDWLDLYSFASEWMWKLCSSQQLVPDHPSSYNWVPSWAWYLCAPLHLSIWAIPGFCFAGCVQLHNIPWTDRAVPPVTCWWQDIALAWHVVPQAMQFKTSGHTVGPSSAWQLMKFIM